MFTRVRSAAWLCAAGGVFAALCVATGCGGDGGGTETETAANKSDIEIAYVCATPEASSFFGPIQKGALEAGEAMGVNVTYTGVGPKNSTPAGLARLIETAANQKPDGLIYCNAWPEALDPVVKRAVESGVPVYEAINTPPKTYVGEDGGTNPISWTNVSNYDGGVKAGEVMAAAGVKHPVCVNHTPGNVSVAERCQGFAKALAGKGIKARTLNLPLSAQNNITAYLNAVKGTLQAHQDTDGLFAQGAQQAVAALKAVKEAGREGEIKVGSFDMSDTVYAAVREGNLLFAVWQQPYLQGYIPVTAAALNAKYGMSPQGLINLGPVVVTEANADRLEKAMENEMG